jgi:hypothetical protein
VRRNGLRRCRQFSRSVSTRGHRHENYRPMEVKSLLKTFYEQRLVIFKSVLIHVKEYLMPFSKDSLNPPESRLIRSCKIFNQRETFFYEMQKLIINVLLETLQILIEPI